MMSFRRGILSAGAVLVCVAAAIAVTAALTTWWVLFALILPAMMVGSMGMMASMARWMPGGSGDARCGCWSMSATGPAAGSERAREQAAGSAVKRFGTGSPRDKEMGR